MASDSYDEQSAFDMSFNTFGRINHLLYNDNNFVFQGDLEGWWSVQKALWLETMQVCKSPKDVEEVEKQMMHCMKIMADFSKRKQAYETMGAKAKNYRFVIDPGVELNLYKLDQMQRTILKKSGVLLRKGEDVTRAMV